jgi:hypothetical protein
MNDTSTFFGYNKSRREITILANDAFGNGTLVSYSEKTHTFIYAYFNTNSDMEKKRQISFDKGIKVGKAIIQDIQSGFIDMNALVIDDD